jgi:transcriptional regulator with XRE-family HTH domain
VWPNSTSSAGAAGLPSLKRSAARLGRRLASARNLAGYTIDEAAQALTGRGYSITKQAVGHWETGKNVPDALWLRRLAKLYGSTLDALVWDEAISMEAIQFAVQYDALTRRNRRKFRAMWLAYFEEAKSDAEVERAMPATRPENRPDSGAHVLHQDRAKYGSKP